MLCIRPSSLGYRRGGNEGRFRSEGREGGEGSARGGAEQNGFVSSIREMEVDI